MRFTETKVKGAFLIDLDPRSDNRGFFARSWCMNEFRERGLVSHIAQINVASTLKRGSVRGLHFQTSPHEEAKTVRCTRGAVYDVVVDLRPSSPTHKAWAGFELSADNHKILYIPEGCAHGYQTLVDGAEIEYLTSAVYAPASARGVRFDDHAFGIEWPLPVGVISDADRSWPDYATAMA
jgi:dTDP-4-dehydrorhamnose 3,5-epimerase